MYFALSFVLVLSIRLQTLIDRSNFEKFEIIVEANFVRGEEKTKKGGEDDDRTC